MVFFILCVQHMNTNRIRADASGEVHPRIMRPSGLLVPQAQLSDECFLTHPDVLCSFTAGQKILKCSATFYFSSSQMFLL